MVEDKLGECLAADARKNQNIGDIHAGELRDQFNLRIVFGDNQLMVEIVNQKLFDRLESSEIDHPVARIQIARPKNKLEAQSVAMKEMAMAFSAPLPEARAQAERVIIRLGNGVYHQCVLKRKAVARLPD